MLECRQSVTRRYSFPLRAGHRAAYMCTETTVYRYMENLDAPKKWFKANIDAIMHTYGPHHPVQREDIFLGTAFCPLLIVEMLTMPDDVCGHCA